MIYFLVPGLVNNLSRSTLAKLGYQNVDERPSGSWTNFNSIFGQKTYCNAKTVLCFGGGLTDSDTISVLACANCFDITTINTTLNQPLLFGQAYWYLSTAYSFGFAPNETISQNTGYDNFDPSNEQRVSIQFSSSNTRVGRFILNQNFSTYFYSIYGIFLFFSIYI